MFELTSSPIDPVALRARLERPEAGALTVFEGRVRNHHLGQAVSRLEYEAFDDLALTEGRAITSEAEQLYRGVSVWCVHRTGALQVGDIAVWIGVASAHRQAGFAACRHVIEEIKLRLPIWKKEHHPDGAAEWVNCSTEAAKLAADDDYYARQISLPEVGAAGQAKLGAARVLIVGVGGLGCPAALYLAGAGVGHLTLVDSGRVERSNLHRQILFTPAEIGAPKALAGAARLRLSNPAIAVEALDLEFASSNARSLVAGKDVVLDCTDNFTTRFLVHDACHALGVPLISAAVHRFEGTLDVFVRGEGGCLHCQWPRAEPAALNAAGRCEGAPVFAPAVGTLGVMQAAEALKLLLGLAGHAARETRLVNLLDGSANAIARPRRPDCAVCGGEQRTDSRWLGGDRTQGDGPSLFLAGASEARERGCRIVYLAEPGENVARHADRSVLSLNDLSGIRALAQEGAIALDCRHGLRSAALARQLRAEGLETVYALMAERRAGL